MKTDSEKTRPAILIVDDQYRTFLSLPRLISQDEYTPLWVADVQEGLNVLQDRAEEVSVIIVDLKSSGMGGGGFLHQARQIAPNAAVLVTAPLGPFLYKEGMFYEFSGPTLKQEINTILNDIVKITATEPRQGGEQKDGKAALKDHFGPIIGRSPSINKIYRLIENLKNSTSTVLIEGESGTGKELIAKTIHRMSARKNRPFVPINCGAIPAALMESELFGHERGAFTHALYQRRGKFEVAGGGTIFLDEIGELDRDLQVKLLRVLQEKEFQRVGGDATHKTDVRIIAASNQDLKRAVQTGQFREDLFYRLNVVPIQVPPLRERREDIPILIDHFFQKESKDKSIPRPSLTSEAEDALFKYTYPGNVRELSNIVERLLVISPHEKIALRDLPEEVLEKAVQPVDSSWHLRELPEEGVPLKEVERELILKTLKKTEGNKVAAARMLGITRRLLYLRLENYGLMSRS
jgi:two-component system, NtrC family, response regulator AtoC